MANKDSSVFDASPITRMQNLEGTQHIKTVVRKKRVMPEDQGEKGVTSQKELIAEELEIEVFKFFKSFRAMRKQKAEKDRLKTLKEKEWDLVSIHTCQTEDSEKTGIKTKKSKIMEAWQYSQAFKNIKFRSPFTNVINETLIPKGLKGPKVLSYDRTGDHDDHVSNFQWAIKIIPLDPKLWSL
ncbi:unnamed protein product [Lactuca virosa]|uniref:Uncharacterized protein n=1 Tax=Lactuca virosa TaxID=75947 RepID=A0AAU9LSW1_9ASTR|nr:unnamed protein product [Lactuca virosa]